MTEFKKAFAEEFCALLARHGVSNCTIVLESPDGEHLGASWWEPDPSVDSLKSARKIFEGEINLIDVRLRIRDGKKAA